MKKKYELAAIIFATMIILPGQLAFSLGVNIDKEKQAFGNASRTEQQNIAFRLSGEGKAGAHALMDLIEKSTDTTARGRAFAGLRQSLENPKNQDKEIFYKLEKMALGDDTKSSYAATSTLMHFKHNPKARAAIKQAIKMQINESIRGELLGALMVNTDRDQSEIPYFRDFFLHDVSEYVKVIAAGYMGRLGDKSGANLCKEILEREPLDKRTKVLQMRAAIAAGTIGDPQLLPLLEKVGSDKKYGIARSDALDAANDIKLGMQPNKDAKLTYLKKALREPRSGSWAVNVLVNMKDKEADALLEWGYSQPEIARNMR